MKKNMVTAIRASQRTSVRRRASLLGGAGAGSDGSWFLLYTEAVLLMNPVASVLAVCGVDLCRIAVERKRLFRFLFTGGGAACIGSLFAAASGGRPGIRL